MHKKIFYSAGVTSLFCLFVVFTASSSLAFNNPYQVKREQQAILASKDASDAERATAAWTLISLDRLLGNEKEARAVFKEFEGLCSKFLAKDEWNKLKAWAKNTKAQEPPL